MAEYSWLIDDIETLSTYTKDGYTKAVLSQAVKAIRKLSADVQPVRHGRWIAIDGEWFDWQCSECGSKRDGRTPFCPNCGAKMDGKENE